MEMAGSCHPDRAQDVNIAAYIVYAHAGEVDYES